MQIGKIVVATQMQLGINFSVVTYMQLGKNSVATTCNWGNFLVSTHMQLEKISVQTHI
jgi:hypothetical protein